MQIPDVCPYCRTMSFKELLRHNEYDQIYSHLQMHAHELESLLGQETVRTLKENRANDDVLLQGSIERLHVNVALDLNLQTCI